MCVCVCVCLTFSSLLFLFSYHDTPFFPFLSSSRFLLLSHLAPVWVSSSRTTWDPPFPRVWMETTLSSHSYTPYPRSSIPPPRRTLWVCSYFCVQESGSRSTSNDTSSSTHSSHVHLTIRFTPLGGDLVMGFFAKETQRDSHTKRAKIKVQALRSWTSSYIFRHYKCFVCVCLILLSCLPPPPLSNLPILDLWLS